ncbi:MAG TPA: ribose-5-phosphate isomerase A, partial [bacterium]|nr:ribose-5-phosphate isomerase A [bacterium]
MADLTELKKTLGTYAADHFVRDGMKVGLGTGSTAIWAARRVAERLSEGSLKGIRAVVTSLQTELEARALGIPVHTLNDSALQSSLDVVIDGADEVDPAGNLI